MNVLRRRDWRTALVLLVGLIHGLIYVFIVPPWQHYDEPSHFEYAALIARTGHLPAADAHDPALLRIIMKSMVQNRFYVLLGGNPDVDNLPDSALSIGYSQLDDAPGYYVIVAPVVWALGGQTIATQLIGVRLMSLCMFVVTLTAAAGLTSELTRVGSPLRWLVPLFMALLPAYVDFMTACNDMVGMITAASLIMWSCVRMIQKGLGWARVFATLSSAALCVAMGSTALTFLICVPPTFVFAALRGPWRAAAWVILGIAGGAVLALSIGTNDAAYWYRGSLQSADLRTVLADGTTALQLVYEPGKPMPKVVQLLPLATIARITGKPLLITGRAWASTPMPAQQPSLNQINRDPAATVTETLSTAPTPFRFPIRALDGPQRGWLELSPFGVESGSTATVYYSDLALTVADEPSPANVLRNGTMSERWPRLRPWETNLRNHLFWGVQFFDMFLAPLDWAATGELYATSAQVIFQSFWAWFGWGAVRAPAAVYYACAILVIIGLIGALTWATTNRRTHRAPIAALVTMALGCSITVFLAVSRGLQTLMWPPFIPVARYLFPVMPLAAFLLVGGVANVAWSLPRRLRSLSLMSPLVVLDLIGLATVWAFYYPG